MQSAQTEAQFITNMAIELLKNSSNTNTTRYSEYQIDAAYNIAKKLYDRAKADYPKVSQSPPKGPSRASNPLKS